MAYTPSQDPILQSERSNDFWEALQGIASFACRLEPQPRYEWEELRGSYIIERRHQTPTTLDSGLSALPPAFAEIPLGVAEIELIDFLINYESDRILVIEGPRGSGKTSLLHYVEAAITHCSPSHSVSLIKVNGLSLSPNATIVEIASIGLSEVESVKQRDPAFAAWAASAEASEAHYDEDPVQILRQTLSLIAQAAGDQARRIVFVIDNIDQLGPGAVDAAQELLKEIHVSSGLACISCLRPGARMGVAMRGSASAFFRFLITLRSPSVPVWIQRLGGRMARALERRTSANGQRPRVAGIDVTPQMLETAMDELSKSLRYRRPDDDALRLLNSVTADDTRHLVLLVRHMMEHRDFPGAQLLTSAANEIDWHPLPCIFEGIKVLFTHGLAVPNLLCMRPDRGNPDFLVCFHILNFLRSGHPEKTTSLIRLMRILGYDRDTVLSCLGYLHRALLVRCTDRESVDVQTPPRAVFATQAGQFYLNHLFGNGDYLLSVIVDVPLRHERLRYEIDSHIVADGIDVDHLTRLDSLVEYIHEVRRREAEQLKLLQSANPSADLRRVADGLANDGLFSASLVRGAMGVVRRNTQQSPKATRLIRRAGKVLRQFESGLKSDDERLREVIQRGRKAQLTRETLVASQTCDDVVFELQEDASSPHPLQARLRFPQPHDFALVSAGSASGGSEAVVAYPGWIFSPPNEQPLQRARYAKAKTALIAPFPGLSRLDSWEDIRPASTLTIQRDGLPFSFLSPSVVDGCLRADLYNIRGSEVDRQKCSPVPVLSPKKLLGVEEAVGKGLKDVTTAVLEGGDLLDRIFVQGDYLADYLLSREGRSLFETFARLSGTLIIFTTQAVSRVPWEWIPMLAEGDLEEELPICTRFSIIRWPDDPISGVCHCAIATEPKPVGQLLTVGWGAVEGKPWTVATPRNVRGFKRLIQGVDTLHLVGHLAEDRLEVEGGLTLSLPDIQYIKSWPASVIVSTCKGATVDDARNVSVAISRQGSVVWTPLIEVTRTIAEAVDARLYEARESSVEEAMKPSLDACEELFLYVRYGFRTNRR